MKYGNVHAVPKKTEMELLAHIILFAYYERNLSHANQ